MKVRIVIVVTLILSFITANVYADVTVDIVGRREVPFKNDFDNKTGDVVNINGLNIHLCSVNGQDCIYNTYAKNPRLIPYDDVAKSIGNTDYIHAGGYYLSRECEEDKAFVAYRPTNSLKVYDENLNLIFDENFGGGVYVTDMGYYNGRFYCIYNEKYKTVDDGKGGLKEERLSDNKKTDFSKNEKERYITVVSEDGKSWEHTESEIPHSNSVAAILPQKSAILNKDMSDVVYENQMNYVYDSAIYDWFVMSGSEGNIEKSVYLSNDNVYFLKLDFSDKAQQFLSNSPYNHIATSFVYEDDIYMKLKDESSYLKMPSQDVYTRMEKLKKAPYVKFDNKILGFDNPPVIENDSTLVPMRFLFEQMGAKVDWNGDTQAATATLGDTAVTFSIDNTQATVNNAPAQMAVPARIIDDKTMVPLRFLSEGLGFNVTWDADTRTATIE